MRLSSTMQQQMQLRCQSSYIQKDPSDSHYTFLAVVMHIVPVPLHPQVESLPGKDAEEKGVQLQPEAVDGTKLRAEEGQRSKLLARLPL